LILKGLPQKDIKGNLKFHGLLFVANAKKGLPFVAIAKKGFFDNIRCG
jgi:hypothetical protein